jgi:hypothetical protein
VAVLEQFIEETQPARFDAMKWRAQFFATTGELEAAGSPQQNLIQGDDAA